MKKIIPFFTLLFLCFTSFGVQDPEVARIKDLISKELKLNAGFDIKITSKAPGYNNVVHYYGVQVLNGLEIENARFGISVKEGEVISFNHTLLKSAKDLIGNNVYVKSAQQALQSLTSDYQVQASMFTTDDNGAFVYSDLVLSDEEIRINKQWFLSNGKLNVCYNVSWYLKDHSHWFNYILDGNSLKEYKKIDWVSECNLASCSKHITKVDGASKLLQQNKTAANSTYNVFARPIESPNHGNRTMVEDPENLDASPFGWHDTNGTTGAEFTITRGNNVYASEDKDANNQAGASPDGGASLLFDAPFDINKSASLYTDASIINLFYWNNTMHDVWWHYGFDEPSGNFQSNNYGNGGQGGDFVRADAQDGSGTNNANFATPPDGQNPRMQMFLWGGSNSDFFRVNSPSAIADKYGSARAGFGPDLASNPVTGDLVLVQDGSGRSEDGCSALTNANDVDGKIALIRRGTCTFVTKVKNAQNAGAIGVVIYDSLGTNPFTMGGTDNSINIPSVMISRTNGLTLVNNLSPNTVNVSLYDSASYYDSDFDNGVIAHEYGHGISIRLTGGAANSGCLSNQEQMGEGWSDFFALVMTHEAGDKGTDRRGIGTYTSGQNTNGRGIRNYVYSTDIVASPYTYENIKTFSVPHGVGSVWCSMLWDLYWALIDEYGFDSDIYNGTGGNNIAMQLVIDGLKYQPCNPGFTDGRDAILKADGVNNDGKNQRLIWEVFARRGLGFEADQGSSTSRTDGTSGFGLPPALLDRLVVEKAAVTESENGEDLNYTIAVKNETGNTIRDIEIKDTLDGNLLLDEASLSCDATVLNNIITISLDSMSGGDSLVCAYKVVPRFAKTTEEIWKDDVESGNGNWKIEADNGSGNGNWVRVTSRKNSGEYSWFVDNEAVQTDYSLVNSFEITGNSPILSFMHRYNSEETWDGGVVEIRRKGGNWIDAEPYFLLNGYNATIQSNPASAISEQRAFTGNSKAFILSKIDLSDFKEDSIEVRFRFVSDGAASVEGWYVDDIQIEDGVSVVNNLDVAYSNKYNDRASVTTFITGEGVGASVFELKRDEISVYPNPANQFFIIENNSNEELKYSLQSVSGALLLDGETNSTIHLDISSYETGIYFLKIELDNNITSYKLFIE